MPPFTTDRFNEYVGQFDVSDSKIALKIRHTFRVLEKSEQIARALGLSRDELNLTRYCALYHDLGRFEQVARYHTFLDAASLDHAALSARLLQTGAFLEGFDENERQIIIDAVAVHSLYEIPETIQDPARLQAKILRDADKLDIFRVFAQESMLDSCLCSKEEMETQSFSPKVMESILNHQSVRRQDRKCGLDIFACFLGFFFDLNFPVSFQIAKEEGYYAIPWQMMDFKQEKTAVDAGKLLESTEAYIEQMSNFS